MKKFRCISIALCAVMLIAVFAGCKTNGTQGSDSTSAPATSATTSAAATSTSTQATTTTAAAPNLNKYEFYLAGARNGGTWSENPSNSLEDELVQKYYDVEELLNCVITVGAEPSQEDVVTASVANESLGDFIYGEQKKWGVPAVKNYLRPLDSEEVLAAGLNIFDPATSNQDLVNLSKLNGKHFIVVFETRTMVLFSHGYVFNKRLCAEAGYPADTIYDKVFNFEWTWDYFKEICRAISQDNDGDNVYEVEGLCKWRGEPELSSNGTPSIAWDEASGKYVSRINTEQYKKAVQYMADMYNDKDIYWADAESGGARNQKFYDGQAGFWSSERNDFGTSGVNSILTDDFGFVPHPHGPDATNYIHIVNSLGGFYMQYTNQNWETSCVVMSYLAQALNDYEGADILLNEYFRGDEKAIKVVKEIMYPNAVLLMSNVTKFTELSVLNRSLEIGVAAACEEVDAATTQGLKDFFGY